ncbi:MAG: type IV pilus modification protein PilV [Deltaproteobacteria bacterium RIFCSPLOWO2_02_FULL_53_8]|nr:MAG: type IV pilus modification protein PilV [Deltaproteobacteria bacterium RIFCSPLOWO2_02_FULL_53_8]
MHVLNEKGISLIEVLVSVVVLSIGMLGIAGLQAAVTKYQINIWSRTAISTLYSEISDRIRMNPNVAGSSFVTGVTEASLYVISDDWTTQQSAALTTPSPNCNYAACTNTERAAFDLIAWRQRVRAELPRGTALISGDRLAGFNITLMWFDKEFTDKGNASDSVLTSSLTCDATETGLGRQTCCPAAAAAPAGVRCSRFSFLP